MGAIHEIKTYLLASDIPIELFQRIFVVLIDQYRIVNSKLFHALPDNPLILLVGIEKGEIIYAVSKT